MEMYDYIERSGDILKPPHPQWDGAIMWARDGQYGWISREQVQNLRRRQIDQTKQLKGYMKNKPIDLVFHWSEVQVLDPATVRLMRETS